MNRRGFLKLLGAATAAVAAAPLIGQGTARPNLIKAPATAPLYIPPQHLDYGVPKRALITAPSQSAWPTPGSLDTMRPRRRIPLLRDIQITRDDTIPMLLRQSEYLPEWGGKLPAGSTVLVDRETAHRWIANAVAVPGPGAPAEMQERSARLLAERSVSRTREDERAYLDDYWDAVAVADGFPSVFYTQRSDRAADQLEDRLRRAALRSRKPAPEIQYDDDEFTVPAYDDDVVSA